MCTAINTHCVFADPILYHDTIPIMTKNIETWQIAGIRRNETDTAPLTADSLFILQIKIPDSLTANTIGITYKQLNALMNYFVVQNEEDLVAKEFFSESKMPNVAWALFSETVLK